MSETPQNLNFDPNDPEAIEARLEEIYRDDGPIALEADGDENYLRFLREDAVAQLDVLVHGDDPEILDRAAQTHETLVAYQAYKFGGGPRP